MSWESSLGEFNAQHAPSSLISRQDVNLTVRRQLFLCLHCNETNADQDYWDQPREISMFAMNVPSFVDRERELLVLPVRLSGDGFQMFSSVGCEVEGYDWIPLFLPEQLAHKIRNCNAFAAFPPEVPREIWMQALVKVFARCEMGFWAWNIITGSFNWVMLCIGIVSADMPDAAKSAGLLNPSRAGACSRLTVLSREHMLDPGQLLAAAPRTQQLEQLLRQEASKLSKSASEKLLSSKGYSTKCSLSLRSGPFTTALNSTNIVTCTSWPLDHSTLLYV